MAPCATRLLLPLLWLARGAVASGLAASGQCTAVLHSVAGRDDLELAALCRARLPQEQCRLAKVVLGSQPWSPEKVDSACATWDETTRELRGVNAEGTLRAKDTSRARSLEDGVVTETEKALDAALQGKLAQAPLGWTTTTTNTDEARFWRRQRRSLLLTGERDDMNGLPGGEAIMDDMGLAREDKPEPSMELAAVPPPAPPVPQLAAVPPPPAPVFTPVAEQKWARTALQLKKAVVSSGAWPLGAVLACVLLGSVAPILRVRFSRDRRVVRTTPFKPLMEVPEEGRPASPAGSAVQGCIEA